MIERHELNIFNGLLLQNTLKYLELLWIKN